MTPFRLLGALCAWCAMLLALPVHADGQQRLQAFLEGVKTLSADFEQVQFDEAGAEIARRSGEFWLARPGRFRWRYSEPYEQLMVCDGEQIWNYEPDLAQVTVRSAQRVLQDTPAALLAGGDLRQGFEVEDGGEENATRLLRLKPKTEDADFRLIELWLDAQGVPQRIRFHDPLGGSSDIRFSKLQVGQALKAELFEFQPPQGVEIVRLEGEGG